MRKIKLSLIALSSVCIVNSSIAAPDAGTIQRDIEQKIEQKLFTTDEKNNLVPFPEKFPEEAEAIKKGLDKGVIDIALHGLTHCVVGKHLPRFFSSNRSCCRCHGC